MKRLIVCNLVEGGICHYTYSLANALQENGNEVTVLTQSQPAYELGAFAHKHRVKNNLELGTSKISRLTAPLSNLRKVFSESQNTDIVHYQWPMGPRTDRLQWPMLKRLGKRIVYTAHNVVPHEQGNKSQSHVDWLYATADAIIVHGETLREQLLKSFRVPPEKVHIVPLGNYNFLADVKSKWNRPTARQTFGWTGDEFVVLFFGLIRPYKGLDVLIKAMNSIMARNPEAQVRLRLLIAGSAMNDYWAEGKFEEQLAKDGLILKTQCILQHIPIEDIPLYFMASDLVALPYKAASQSAVLQLAYAFSKPVVVTDTGSIKEVVVPGTTGLVVPPNDAEAFADAIEQLFCDPNYAAEMGKSGRIYSEEQLSWQKIAKQTQEIYRTVSDI